MIDRTNQIQKLAYNHREAAAALGVCERTLTAWASDPSKNLPRIKIGRLSRYPVAALQQWLDDRLVAEREGSP